jgi:electron transport complex protein RnfC
LFKNKSTFKGGVLPPLFKETTASLPIEPLPPPATVIIPLSQHAGVPAKVIVRRGDRIRVGQLIGESGDGVSCAVHSSVSGTVLSIGDFPHPSGKSCTSVEIENDGTDEPVEMYSFPKDWREAAPGEILQKLEACGIVGMGGSGFPTHLKLTPRADRPIDTLIVNGIESEPYLNADYRLLLEKTEQVLTGTLIIKKILGAQRACIALDSCRGEAIRAVQTLLAGKQFQSLALIKLKTKYPQGNEKVLISTVTGREIQHGEAPVDAGCLVQNVATVFAVWEAVYNGTPLYQRVITVAGRGVARPKNLLVRVGTPLRTILDHCGADLDKAKKVVMGGAMAGLAQSDLGAPLIKSATGLVVFDTLTPAVGEFVCINCGYCQKACPMRLVPSLMVQMVDSGNYDEARRWYIADCIECGACSYVCPSKLNIVHRMKLGKFYALSAQSSS